ncbi:unnamed protein product [Symbiodinium pilosum]|uniref:TauD/TfdA-like domain-containing protein n=1 Tax=Symbiodinium pilosum TaxID=2952 RepID=A0A812JYM3_SYMPI|nr:unnamed protein product [Symbiodinium pilosum]
MDHIGGDHNRFQRLHASCNLRQLEKFNEKLWIAAFSFYVRSHEEFSDAELDMDILRILRLATKNSLSSEVLMSPGDVIVLDNWKWAHGRRPYVGNRLHGSVISDRRPRSTAPKRREEL